MPRAVLILALAGALATAAAAVLIRQGLRGGNAYGGYWVNLAVGTVGLWVAVLVRGPLEPLQARGIAFFVLAGLVGTVAGRLLRFISIEKVGASVTAALNNLYPFISSGLAILLLGERVTMAIVAGTVVIVLGTLLLSTSGRHVGFRPRDLVFPILSATCFGVVTVLRKLGLGSMSPVPGFAVNVTTALIAFTAFLAVSGNRDAMALTGRSLAYFVAAGVAENAGVFLALLALNLGTVSVVAPLAGTAPIFVLLMSFFFLRGVERLTARVVLGTLFIVLGVYLITAL
jgi:drug/metabolite transporter, DME family